MLCLLAMLVLAGCAPEVPPGRHALLIILDAARPDRLGAYDATRETSPNLDALAERGVVFVNHFSQATDTRSALPRLLYSRYFIPPLFPLSARVPFSHPSDLFRERDAEAISLPAVMAANGFHTAMISAHTWLKPSTAFAREFAEAHDISSDLRLEPDFPHPRAEAVVDFALDWLERHRERDVFLYLHLMDTHSPRFFEGDAAALYDGPPDDAERWAGTRDRELRSAEPFADAERRALDAIYDGSVRYTDRHLGRLFDLYREWRVLDRTLIAVTADHGEILLERPGVLGHGGPWYDLVARVPLIVSYPDRLTARRIEAETESVDILPTLVGLLDLELPGGTSLDGVDLLAADAAVPGRPTIGHRALRVDGFKVIFEQSDDVLLARDASDPSDLTGELYDLAADPGETSDLWSERPEIVASALTGYRDRLGRPYARYRRTRTERQPDSSFAIAARHFRTERPVPTLAQPRTPAAGGWVLSDHWQDSYLASHPGASPLGFEFELPDGVYELSAAISDGCRLELPQAVAGAGRGSRSGETVRFGEIEVEDQLFRGTLSPGPGRGQCSISYLGFRPAGAAREDTERDERLRALGYVD